MLRAARRAGSAASSARLTTLPPLLRRLPPPHSTLALLLRASASAPARCSSSSAAAAGPAVAGPAAAADAAKPASEETEEERQRREDEAYAAAEEPAYDPNEPLVARASRLIWTSIKLAAGMGLVGLLCYAGYTIVTTLLPVGASSNAIMRKASDAALHDPEVHAYFGDGAKTYGLDPGGRAEGRRYFVPEYKYDDPLTGEKFHRVKFNLEGDRGRKAWVFAEVAGTTHEFRYLIVATKDGQRVISVVDRRPPPLSVEERQSRVSTLLQDADWGFYADSEGDVRAQGAALGDTWLKVKCVRCDDQPERCAEAGVPMTPGSLPVWKTSAVVKGLKSLDDLEKLVLPLAVPKAKSWFW